MKYFRIISNLSNDIIFGGEYPSFKNCLEEAVLKRTDLSYANLRHQNLSNANLDDARMAHADLKGTNLTGANLSESHLVGADFSDAALFNTCLAWSDLNLCNFEGSRFGATDITGANISGATFSTLSCFSLDFFNAGLMEKCRFKEPDGTFQYMSQPPLVIHGLGNKPVVFFDHHTRGVQNILQKIEQTDIQPLLNALINIFQKQKQNKAA